MIDRASSHHGAYAVIGSFDELSGGGAEGKYPTMIADRVDLLEVCGGVDPLPLLDDASAKICRDSSLMFPCGVGDADIYSTFRAGPRDEYLRLLQRQLDSGKVALAR
jgi:hypothetical protein